MLKTGKGPKPKKNDWVTVAYSGQSQLFNGKAYVFVYKKTGTFWLPKVIPGWNKAIRKMRVGSTWIVYIAPKLAYGTRGYPLAKIGPNQALTYTLYLIAAKAPLKK